MTADVFQGTFTGPNGLSLTLEPGSNPSDHVVGKARGAKVPSADGTSWSGDGTFHAIGDNPAIGATLFLTGPQQQRQSPFFVSCYSRDASGTTQLELAPATPGLAGVTLIRRKL